MAHHPRRQRQGTDAAATPAAPARSKPRPSARLSAAAAAAGAGDALAGGGEPRPVVAAPAVQHAHTVQRMLLLGCVTMAAAAVHRTAFAVLAPPIQAELGLSLPQMGHVHSALLVGYVLGQIPAGLLADRLGGAHLAAVGLGLWSLACALVSLVPSSGTPFVVLLATRAALGLAQSGLMPSMSALAGGRAGARLGGGQPAACRWRCPRPRTLPQPRPPCARRGLPPLLQPAGSPTRSALG